MTVDAGRLSRGPAGGQPPEAQKVLRGLFEDADFPARWSALLNPCDAVAWLRPHELCREPRLFVDGAGRVDVESGARGGGGGGGGSRLLASCAALAQRPDLFNKLIPEGQALFGEGYDGCLRFRFLRFDEEQEVRVDDRLPVDAAGRPAYARCALDNEFWLPLLEKAVAKFKGGYDEIDINICELVSGLYTSTEHAREWEAEETFDTIKDALAHGALIICYAEDYLKLPGDFFTITKVYHRQKSETEDELRLLRLRSPCGRSCGEWAGAWRDGDERWKALDNATKEFLQYNPGHDGEFWMALEDFAQAFSSLTIAREKPAEFQTMKVVEVRGTWKPDEDSQGSVSDSVLAQFVINRQYLMEVESDAKGEGTQPTEVFMDVLIHPKGWRTMQVYVFEIPDATERKFQVEELPELSLIVPNTKGFKGRFLPRKIIPGSKYLLLLASESSDFQFILRLYSSNEIRLKELTA